MRRTDVGGVLAATSGNLRGMGKKKLAKLAKKTIRKIKATEKKIKQQTCDFDCPSTNLNRRVCEAEGCIYLKSGKTKTCTPPLNVYVIGSSATLTTYSPKDFNDWKSWNTQTLMNVVTRMGEDLDA